MSIRFISFCDVCDVNLSFVELFIDAVALTVFYIFQDLGQRGSR